MSVDVYIESGISISVTPQASPTYVIGSLPVLAGTGGQFITASQVDAGYYPRSNPSGYATGIDGSLYVRKTDSGMFVTTGQIIKFSTLLNSGAETQTINYPLTLSVKPTAVTCSMENNVDNLIYSYVLLGVSSSGFMIGFSDNLSTSGYTLYTTLNI